MPLKTRGQDGDEMPERKKHGPVHAEALQRILVSFRHNNVKTERFRSSRAKEIAANERRAIRVHERVHLVVTASNLLVVRATVRGHLGPVLQE